MEQSEAIGDAHTAKTDERKKSDGIAVCLIQDAAKIITLSMNGHEVAVDRVKFELECLAQVPPGSGSNQTAGVLSSMANIAAVIGLALGMEQTNKILSDFLDDPEVS